MPTNIEYFNNSGSNNWYAPHGVKNVAVEGFGAGAAGANRNSNGSGGGGAGGAYAKLNSFAATAGNTYALTVGTPGNTNNNSNGTDTSFNTSTLVAKGGNTAGRNNATGQTAFANASSTGDVVFRGGNGATGASPNANNGGGGGSSGGNNGVGVDGVGNNGGIASLPGGAGAGGNGAKNGSAVGINGTFPGGAGGGATRNSATNRNGGNGANGQIKITYDFTANAIDLDGSTQYGTLNHMTEFETMTDWYAEMWIKTKSNVGPYDQFLTIENATDGQIGLSSENGEGSQGLNFFQGYDGANSADGFIDNSAAPVPIGTWTHVGARHNSVTKYTTIIVNGRPWISYPGGFPQLGDGPIRQLIDGVFKLGNNQSGSRLPATVGGFLRLFNRFVGNSEIYANYQKTLNAAKESGLIININYTEGAGTTLDNQAGGNDMTLTGTPPWVPGPATAAKDYTYGHSYPYVNASADDAEQVVSNGNTDITSTGLELVYDTGVQQIVGMRFPSVNIPQGATIVHSYLRLLMDGVGATTTVTVEGENTDNSAQFVAGAGNSNISGRSRTTANVSWLIPVNSNRDMISSSDLAAIIQEVVNRGGWVSGNAITLIFSGVDTDPQNVYGHDFFPQHLGPSLEIEWYKRNTASFTVDGIITSGTSTFTFTVDGIIALRNTATFTVDGIVLLQNTKTFTVDGVVLVQTTKTFTVDGLITEKTENLRDNFDAGFNGSKWNQQPSLGTIDFVNKQVEFTSSLLASYNQVEANIDYDLRSSYVLAKLVSAGDQSLTSLEAILYVAPDATNKLYWTINGNTINARKIVSGVNSLIASDTYDANVHKWFRIRESLNTIYFDYSTNGISWTNLTSLTNPLASVDSVIPALQQGTYGVELSQSTVIWDSFNVSVVNNTFTVDGIIKEIKSSTITVDGIVLETITKTFTVDGIVFATNIKSFTVDGVVQTQGNVVSFTVDGIVLVHATQTFTVDGIVLETQTKTFTVDGIVFATNNKTFTVDGIVFATNSQSFTVDGIVKEVNTKTFTVDAIVKEINTASFTVDGIVLAQTTKIFTVDGIIFATNNATFTVDAIVIDTGTTKTFTVDGIIFATNIQTFTVDGIVLQTQTKTFTVDGVVLEVQTKTFTVDGVVLEQQTKTFTVDAIVQTQGNLTSFTVDGIVQTQGNLSTFTVDGIVKTLNNEASFTVDGIILQLNLSTFTVDGIVKSSESVTFNIDGIVLAHQTSSFTVDGLVAERTSATFTVDGIVVIRNAQTISFTVDAIVVNTNFGAPGGRVRSGLWKPGDDNRPIGDSYNPIGDPREIPVIGNKNKLSGDLFGE